MSKVALAPSDAEIAAIRPESGPWTVEILHRLFHYAPFKKDVAVAPNGHVLEIDPGGFAYARNGDTVTLINHEDYVRGLRHGAFVDPTLSVDDSFGSGPGDYRARPDLVEYVQTHKVDDVLNQAGSDPDMAQLLMDAENEAKPNGGEPRKGVIAGLQAVIDAYMAPSTPADAGLTLADHAAAVAAGREPTPTTETPDGTVTTPGTDVPPTGNGEPSTEAQ